MMKERKSLGFVQQEERGDERPITDGDVNRLRSAQRLMDEVASRIPPLSPEQIHSVVESDRLPQFQLRRQADRWLLTFCLFVLALAASLLWHTAPAGSTPLNIAVLILAVVDAVVALRAARSLWLMRQTLRLRHRPYRMSRYADRLNRLSRRRRLWLDFILRGSKAPASAESTHRFVFATQRIPSYAIGMICIALLAGAFTWLVINKSQSDAELLLASNHKVPSAIVPKHVSPFDGGSRCITPSEPTLAQIKTKASTSEYTPKTSVSSAKKPLLPTESLPEVSNDPNTSNENMLDKISPIGEMNQLLAHAEVRVTCNSDFCSTERYCAMIYEDIWGV